MYSGTIKVVFWIITALTSLSLAWSHGVSFAGLGVFTISLISLATTSSLVRYLLAMGVYIAGLGNESDEKKGPPSLLFMGALFIIIIFFIVAAIFAQWTGVGATLFAGFLGYVDYRLQREKYDKKILEIQEADSAE